MDEVKDGDAALVASLRALARSPALGGSELAPHPEDAAFASYVSRTLETPERERFERHVATCDRCAEDLAAVVGVEATAEAQSRPAPEAQPVSPDAGEAWHRPASSTFSERRERHSTGRGRGSSVRRKIVRRLSVAAVAVLVVSLGLVAAGNLLLGRMAPTAAARLGAMVGRPVQIGDLALAFVPEPALRVRDFRVPDDPRFSSGDLVSLGSADLAVDPRSLWQGRLYGSVRLQRPTLRLIRDAVGEWNVETLTGGSSDGAPDSIEDLTPSSAGPSEEAKVRLVSADITAGTLAVTDRSGGHERELVLHDVDLAYRATRTTEPSSVALEGKIGGRSVVLRGEIGPFEGHTPPQYRFAEVSLADVDLTDIPGAPAAMTGRMTFTGQIEGTGNSLGAIVQSATGGGSLDLCCGTLAQRNLDRDLVATLESVVGAPGRLADRLAAQPATAAELAAVTTGYQRLGGRVAIDAVRVAFSELGAQTRLFTATTSGGVARDGYIDVNGKVTLGPELTEALLAAAPALGTALEKSGAPRDAIALPFALVGRWPDVALRVDVASTFRTAGRAIDPRRLAWSLRLPLARG